MENCIFCQIISGKSPAYKIYDDKDFLVILDTYPRAKGHCLVIPKTHYRWVYDVPNFIDYWLVVLKLTEAMKKVFRPNFITYVTHGLEIEHAHIHVLPRVNETEFVPPPIKLPKEEMEKITEKIREEIKKL